ncbi:response regulator transcription factor [Paraburkholderia sediminicola]|uniref:response regulator n=1 Tax=Paraburkholderia sediminicola TaxID=458836 RepID=UPI0038B841FA
MTTVLIVDDHPAFRLVVKTQISQLSGVSDVIEADNGQAAVELARQHLPDLVILDLDIPRINGLDVVPRLKLAHPGIRVLVLSGHDPAAFSPRVMRSGAQGFVGKSQELKEIVRGIEAVLAGYTVFPMTSGGAGMGVPLETGDEEGKLKLLSDKEIVILQMLSKGMSNKAIGDALFISDKTVSTYKSRIQEKLGLSSLAALIEFASLHRLND